MTNKFPAWTPVRDEHGNLNLPKESGTYLITTHFAGEDPTVNAAFYDAPSGVWLADEYTEYDAEDDFVTAWMVAPDPYEGTK